MKTGYNEIAIEDYSKNAFELLKYNLKSVRVT